MTTQSDLAPEDLETVHVTRADLPKCMAMIRFQMEADAGHPLPRDAVSFKIIDGEPVIVTTYSEIRDE